MKKLTMLITLTVFMLAGSLFQSCEKDDTKELRSSSTSQVVLKAMSDFDLPIYMGKTTLIGQAEINIADPVLLVDVNLDPSLMGEWYAVEAHLYAADAVPPSPAPGQFPYHWYLSGGEPLGFEIDISWWECTVFDWYFALHLELEKQVVNPDGTITLVHETAWLLPEEGGKNWKNGKGKNIGWGQYFLFYFDYIPVISEPYLLASTDQQIWEDYYGGEALSFTVCLESTNLFYYFDAAFNVNVPLEEGTLNEFFLEEVTEQYFWDYWNDKGVNESASGGWEEVMWDIINGDAPMFYIKWNGSDHSLIDGLQYQFADVENPLRISGNYPPGTYLFTGTVTGENCVSGDITFSLTIEECIL